MLRNFIRNTSRALIARTSKQTTTQIQYGLFLHSKPNKNDTKILANMNSTIINNGLTLGCQRRNFWWGAEKKIKTAKQIQEQLNNAFNLLEDDNNPKEALKIFDQLVEQIDKNDAENSKILVKALYGKAKSHAMLSELDQAIESASKATEADPTDGYPYFLRGSLYLDSGDKIKAQEQFLKAVELTPDIYFAWIALAQMHFRDKNFQKAKEYVEKAQEFGYDETLFFILGALAANERDFNVAEENLRKSLKLHHKNPEVLTFLSAVCVEKGKYHDALELINRAIKLSDSRPGLYLSKGEICLQLEEFGDAAMAFEKYLTFDKQNPQALNGIAASLLYLGQVNDALKMAKELVENHSTNPRGWTTLAAIYMALNNKEEALKCYNKSVDLTPNLTDEKREKIRAKVIEQVNKG